MKRAPFLQLFVVGLPSRARRDVGLALARSLHRPFLDADGVQDDDSGFGERERLERLVAVSDAAVYAVSPSLMSDAANGGDDVLGSQPRWVVTVGDGDSSGVDAVTSSTVPVVDAEIARLVREFHDATRRTIG